MLLMLKGVMATHLEGGSEGGGPNIEGNGCEKVRSCAQDGAIEGDIFLQELENTMLTMGERWEL